MIINQDNSNSYNWGDGCVAWQLVNTSKFYVVEEVMPPNSKEIEHHHDVAIQYFYILEGTAVFTVKGKDFIVNKGESIFIESGTRHMVKNDSDNDLKMLIISSPPSLHDRIE